MKKLFLTASFAFVAVQLTGCVQAPTKTEVANADYGTPISQQDAEQEAHTFMHAYLKDPDSATWECHQVHTAWQQDDAMDGGKRTYGYKLGCMINSKNSFGGYTGAKPYGFLYRDGKLVAAYYFHPGGGTEKIL